MCVLRIIVIKFLNEGISRNGVGKALTLKLTAKS